MCILASCADPTSPGVWWRDDARWSQYGPLASRAILRAHSSRFPSLDLSHLADSELPSHATYRVDLLHMKQINQSSHHEREIRIIMPPAPAVDQETDRNDLSAYHDSKSLLKDLTVKLQECAPREMLSFRRKVIEALFDKLCNKKVLLRSIAPLVDPHVVQLYKSSSNCRPVEGERTKFADVVQALTGENPSLYDEVLINLLKGKEVEESSETVVRYVFMGAEAIDVKNILKQGSLQGYAGRQGFNWFGLTANNSLPYCSSHYPKAGAYRILVVLVVPKQHVRLQGKRGLRVADTAYSLPLATADILVLPASQ